MMQTARRLAADAAAHVMDARRLAELARSRGVHGLALNYHVIRAGEMKRHLDILRDLFDIVPLEVLAAAAEGSHRRVPLALTFDDGKRSHWLEIAPLLESERIPAAFFVTSEPSRTGSIHWFDLARRIESRSDGRVSRELRTRLKRVDAAERDAVLQRLVEEHRCDSAPRDVDEAPMTPEEIAAISRMGFTIGSHSATHPILTLESEARVQTEVEESRRQIGEWIGAEVRHFAYPNGNASDLTERFTRLAGYETAWTTSQKWIRSGTNPHRIPRVQVFPRYDRGQIVLKTLLAAFALLPAADGTGYAFPTRTPSRTNQRTRKT
jgi:peptidoglycan/xylan/chitin deacetylase (PgdA/CDA1 family)